MKTFCASRARWAAVLATGLSLACAVASAASAAVVTSRTNVHAEANVSSPVIGQLAAGTAVSAACSGAWCSVGKGWVLARYLRMNGGKTAEYGARPKLNYYEYEPGYDDNYTGFFEYGYSPNNGYGFDYGPFGAFGPFGYGPWYGYGPWPGHWHGHHDHDHGDHDHADNDGGNGHNGGKSHH